VTAESLANRCEVMLPPDLIKDKTVLDVGCALGAMGYWSLENGASHYDGVEIQEGYLELSREFLMRKYNNCIVYRYFDDVEKQYDIVVAAGYIHGQLDLVEALRKICSHSKEYVILETHSIEGSTPSIALTVGNMINFADVNKPFSGLQMMPNRPAIDLLMKCNGFDLDVDLFPKPILGSHDAYNTKTGADRFIARYKRSGKMATLEEAINVGV